MFEYEKNEKLDEELMCFHQHGTILLSEVAGVSESVFDNSVDILMKSGVSQTIVGELKQVESIWLNSLKHAVTYKMN